MTLVTGLLWATSIGPGAALEKGVLEGLAAVYLGQVFELRANLHAPDPRGHSMQAPTLTSEGWYHHNLQGPVLLRAGSRVEVTGAFNYSERGFFLELAAERPEGARMSEADRPRLRVRFMVESPPAEIDEQREQAIELLDKVLGTTGAPGAP